MTTILILASNSQVRRQLLEAAGVSVAVVSPTCDEDGYQRENPDMGPQALSSELAYRKALSVSCNHLDNLVIGVDQVLDCHGRRYTKANNLQQATDQLKSLCGQTHELYTSISCVYNQRPIWQYTDIASLTMRNMSDDFIAAYVERNSSTILSAVGCYQMEAEGIQLFSAVSGPYHSILGLPLLPLLGFLREQKIIPT